MPFSLLLLLFNRRTTSGTNRTARPGYRWDAPSRHRDEMHAQAVHRAQGRRVEVRGRR